MVVPEEKNSFFTSFYLWEGVMVLEQNSFFSVSTVGGCGSLERTLF